MTTTFADALIMLGQHMKPCPNLPKVYSVCGAIEGGLELRLYSRPSQGATELAAWAATLTDVTSWARRCGETQVDGHVVGVLGDHRVEVIAVLPSELFPAERGADFEWDVTTLLQEA